MLELFAESPFWSVGGLAARLDVAYTTARRAIERLEAAGIVTLAWPTGRGRVYCARDMLKILEEPAALAILNEGTEAP